MNIKKVILSSLVSIFFSLPVFAFDQYITVKFKSDLDKKQLEYLNKMTDTSISKVLGKNKYKFKIERIGNKDTLDKYSELFSNMKNVENVSPVPKQKIGDKYNPVLYMNETKTLKETTDLNNKNNQPQDYTITTVVPDEIIVKFNQDSSLEDIKTLNDYLGGSVTYQKDSESYKVKIPEYMDYDYAKNFYENNKLVKSVERSVNTTTKKAEVSKTNVEGVTKNTTGLVAALPIAETSEIKVTFKIGQEDDGYNWLNENFGLELVSNQGFSTYILNVPKNVNIKALSRGLKVCPFISSSELFFE